MLWRHRFLNPRNLLCCEKMVKSSIIAIIVILLLSIVFVGAAQKWGYTRYGAVYYYGEPYYTYAPLYIYPYGSPYSYYRYYGYPSYMYPYYPYYESPLSSEYMYRYGAPTPGVEPAPRGTEGQMCGLLDGRQYGCYAGLVCDYTKGGAAGIGVCARPASTTTYPYQVASSTTQAPYYYG
jgi:hypothetical protein